MPLILKEHALQKARQESMAKNRFAIKKRFCYVNAILSACRRCIRFILSIKPMVRFARGNLLDRDDREILANEKPYHLIFCRNLLIYLSNEAKNMQRLYFCAY